MHTRHRQLLWRAELTAESTRSFIESTAVALCGLQRAISAGTVAIVGQFPLEAQVLPRVERWLAELRAIEVADAPGLA